MVLITLNINNPPPPLRWIPLGRGGIGKELGLACYLAVMVEELFVAVSMTLPELLYTFTVAFA